MFGYKCITVVDPWNMQSPPLQEIPLNVAHFNENAELKEAALDAPVEDMSQRAKSKWREEHNSKPTKVTRTRRY